MNTRALLNSVGIAGVAAGLLSVVPVLSYLNCVLCGWLWLGAIFAVFLYRKFSPENPNLSVGQGALVGLLMAVVTTVVSMIIGVLPFATKPEFVLLPYIEEIVFSQAMAISQYLTTMAGVFLFSLFVYGVFGILGGVISAGVIWKAPKTA